MRRRSDGQQPAAPSGGAELAMVQCACGLKMSIGTVQRNEGRCLSCGKVVTGADAPAEAPASPPRDYLPEDPPPKPDTAKLAAQSVETKEPAKQTFGADEQTFSDLAKKLEAAGLAVPLPAIAKWTVAERQRAAAAADARGSVLPTFLEPYFLEPTSKARSEVATGDCVSATWGEEKFSPGKGSFSMCTVGPFTFTTTVREGESRQQALRRLSAELAEFASAERHRKIQDFLSKYGEFSKATAS